MKYISLHSVYYPFMFESWPMLIDKEPRKKEHRMAHTHPRAKTTYMTNPKCLNVIHQNTSLYILFHAILSYLNLTNPHKHICCENKATHGRHTSKHRNNIHSLSNMLYYDAPQYAFPQGRRSSALRLNTRCKDLTLVPSMSSMFCASQLMQFSLANLNWK